VAPVETLGKAQNRGERANRASAASSELGVTLVPAVRRRPPVVARDQRHRFDFVGFEAAQITVFDQVIGVLVVLVVGDMDADVVEQRRIFEPFAMAISERVGASRLVEEADGQPRDL
jgi:hypothetical protein